MKIYSKSDVGLVRENNQDYYEYGSLPNNGLFIIACDGMGGAKGGSMASHIAVKMIADNLKKLFSTSFNEKEVKDLMHQITQEANSKVFDLAVADEKLTGMGTTIVFAILYKNKLNLFHAGDSRAYILFQDELNQITTDHSIVQEMINVGEITEKEAENHPRKNVITRALGVEKELKLDFYSCDLDNKNLLLFCTDGLTNSLTNEEMCKILLNKSSEDLASDLVIAAKNKDGGDNITAIVIDLQEDKLNG